MDINQAYKDGFILQDGIAFCPYCGHKMQDKGDSWFCADTDCINNVKHPKAKKKEKSKAEMCWEHLLYLCEKRFSVYDVRGKKKYTRVQIFRHEEPIVSGCEPGQAVSILLPKTDDGEEIVLYRDGTWGIS